MSNFYQHFAMSKFAHINDRDNAIARDWEKLRAENEALKQQVEQVWRDAVPDGWCFYHADFSLQAAGKSKVGTVTFIRDAVGREWWHSLPEEQQEETPLYVYGKGRTVMEAIAAAPKREKWDE